MKLLWKLCLWLFIFGLGSLVALNVWGYFTLGSLQPQADALRDPQANKVVMVFGATGSVGDGLLKAALADPGVDKIYVVTRRESPRIQAGAASGRLTMILHQDFTDYSSLEPILGEVNTVLWGLGTSSLQVDDATYTWIHVDFPLAFVAQWLLARTQAPMSFHYITGMGTDPEGSAHWAREKGRAELELAAMAQGTGLRTFGYRSAYVRPTAERANALSHLGNLLLRPGKLVITATELGNAMLEISTRVDELANGTLIDNADSLAYAELHSRASTGDSRQR